MQKNRNNNNNTEPTTGDVGFKISKIKKAKSVSKKLELFFNYIPVLFWHRKAMIKILGPFTALVAVNEIKMRYIKTEYIKSYPKFYLSPSGRKNRIGSDEVNKIIRSFMDGDKIKCSVTDVLYFQEACNDLYNLIEKREINDLKELKACCSDNTNFIIGSTICKIIMDDLEELCKNEHHSKVVEKLATPDWLADCIFDGYMFYKAENTLKYEFMFSYETDKTEIGKWLEKITIDAIQKLEIHPVNVAQYFSLLKSERCEKYLPFYAAYVKYLIKNANDIRYCKDIPDCPDPLGMLFLVTLGKSIIQSENKIKEQFAIFLENHYQTQDEIYNAFFNSLKENKEENKNWIVQTCKNGHTLKIGLNSIGENFLKPIVMAIINGMSQKGVRYRNLEAIIYLFLSVNNISDCYLNVYLSRSGELFDRKRLNFMIRIMDELDYKQKLLLITSLVELASLDFKFPVIINEIKKAQKSFKSHFYEAFENCIGKDMEDLNSELLFRLVQHRNIIELKREQIFAIKDMAEKYSKKHIFIKKLFELLDTDDLKKEMGIIPEVHNRIEKGNIINIREKDDKIKIQKNTLEKRIRSAKDKNLMYKKEKMQPGLAHKLKSERLRLDEE